MDRYLKDHQWEDIAETYNLLGVLYFENNDYLSSRDYLSKALEVAGLHQFPQLKERIYHNFGMLCEGEGNLFDSEKYYSKALDLRKASQSPGIDLTYRCLIDLDISKEKFDQAGNMLKEAIASCSNEKELHLLKMLKGHLHLNLGNEKEYERHTKEAIHYLYEKRQWKSLKGKIGHFADYLSKNRRNKEAVHFYKLEIEIREKIDLEGSK